jgi:hypothetical protein
MDKTTQSGPGLASLFVGVLIAPVTWAIQMQLNYTLVRRGCIDGSSLALSLVASVSLLITVIGAAISWHSLQQAKQELPTESGGLRNRSQFMAILGLMMNGLFFLVILAQGIATGVFHPCQL